MGAIGGLIGASGGINGTGIAGPSAAPINPGVDNNQLQTAYGGAQNSLQSQQALLQALQAQNGIGNQSQVYNQLQGVANGTGPNPAQAQLAQATGANTANQAALMAGQRGASANVGLLARQAAMQGAANQQNSIGQGASLQAQQSLNAMNAAGSMANQQAANQIGATTANTQANQSEQQLLQNANAQNNNANVSMQGNINAVQGQLANTTMQGQQGLIGGAMQGIGQAMTLADGGVVGKYADGGTAAPGGPGYADFSSPGYNLGINGLDKPPPPAYGLGVDTTLPPAPAGPQSSVGQFLSSAGSGSPASAPSAPVPSYGGDSGADALRQGMSSIIGSGSKSIKDLSSSATSMMGGSGGSGGGGGMGGLMSLAMLAAEGGTVGNKLKKGGRVPGKPKVAGNSYANDNVKALLSPGELVVDRETMADGGPAGQAARFLAAVIQKKKGKK